MPIAFIVLVQTFAGFSAFVLARRLVPQKAALFSAACYAANPNALLMIYFRSDYAELLASAFFPLLFLGGLQLSEILEPSAHRRLAATLVLFSVIFAAVWLSNAPAAVMATYSATLLFTWAAFTRKSWQPLARGATSLALGFGLAAFYIVPAAFEQRWVNISQALSIGLFPSENFLYTTINDPEHTLVNYIVSTIAMALIVFTGVAAITAHRELMQQNAFPTQPKIWSFFLLLATVTTVLMLRFSSILWQLLPKLRFVQFPWRWMSILTIPFIYVLAATVTRRRLRWLCIAATLALLIGTAVYLVQHTWWDDEEFSTLRDAIDSGDGFDGTDEYDPIGDDHYNLPQKTARAQLLPVTDDTDAPNSQPPASSKVVIDRWNAQEKVLRVQATQPARLALRLLNYPAWQVEVNGARIQPEHPEDSGQMLIPLRAGESRITVCFGRTRDRTLGAFLSIFSSMLCLFLLMRSRSRAGREVNPKAIATAEFAMRKERAC